MAPAQRCLIQGVSVALLLMAVSRSQAGETCQPKFKIDEGHSACLGEPGDTLFVLPAEEQKEIVDLHNQLRGSADPPASNMMMLRWDAELAMIAQKWADNCHIGHDKNKDRNIPGRITVDQNIAAGTTTWTQAINLWHREVDDFTYDDQSMNQNLLKIGHYTAVMWASKTLIGCGRQECKGSTYHVCNYAEGGNMVGQLHHPYDSGEPCGDCPNHCTGKLCDCELTCLNSGTLSLESCTCECPGAPPLFMAPDCRLNCSGEDINWCAAQGKCPNHSVYCPHKCNVCPYAGVGYEGPPQDSGTAKMAEVKVSVVGCVALTLIVFRFAGSFWP
ncbi:cysteine-rich venom protein LEI1-like isoform X2 [Babylonia areolata]|uniref:cysteine-rich venom protein LEI1-like isoform X2 n=1 Tax=Babylonia areolata TaxID=304850 RepID=UPI003FD301F5